MSSNLIEDLDDGQGVDLFLEMKATGHAFLTLCDMTRGEYREEYEEISFYLPPTEAGHHKAKIIEDALRAWREQTKEEA
jgi:hypothetical protein